MLLRGVETAAHGVERQVTGAGGLPFGKDGVPGVRVAIAVGQAWLDTHFFWVPTVSLHGRVNLIQSGARIRQRV